jgi:Family of unknown function (DUF6111)
MIRLTELLLLFAPLAVFVVWRVFMPGQVPSRGLILGLAVGLVLIFCGLMWSRFHDAEPPNSVYIPSHIENGRIVPAQDGP